ncbi:MAG: protease complex subunit PrcB family protein [Elusimicrobia bacterium]|nr:protease complex subunit PrcB family protein [Elusimicrobiota bacterium]
MKTRTWAAAVLAAAAFGACAAPSPRRPAEARMRTSEWSGQYGGPLEAGSQVVTNDEGWRELWRRLGKDAPPPPDFAARAAVAVFVGQKPTGGWSAACEEPRADGDDLVLRCRILKPTGFTTQAFAQPWKIVAVPRPKGRVRVEVLPE